MKKKLFLLSPSIPRQHDLVSDLWGIVAGEAIPLGIYYLAAFLRERGYEVAVCDAVAFKLTEEQILNEIKAFSPNFVGISSTTICFANAASIAGKIKCASPRIVTILGGSHVTASMNQAMTCTDFDFGVIGEGEITALELLDALSGNKPIAGIQGVAFRDDQGTLVYGGPRTPIPDLDSLPFPALDLIANMQVYGPPLFEHRSLPIMSMITSRGCPNQCTFCASASFGREYRARSAQNVFEEIKYLKQTHHIRELVFLDDNFLLDQQRIYDLFNMIRAEGLFFHWVCLARISSVDYEFLKFLRDNGCWNIMFGIESGDREILKKIKKNLSLERTAKVIGWCHELGIMTRGLFIIGHPLETLTTIDKTIRYALDLPLDSIMCTLNTPYPGTQQYGEAHTHGAFDNTDWSRFSGMTPVFVPHGLTQEILLEKQTEMFVRFYFRPKIMFRFVIFFFGKGGIRRLERLKAIGRILFLRLRMALNPV